jgi:predicted small lipoprotein YifL
MFFLPRIITVMFLTLLFASTLCACGQKGPLFLDPRTVPYKLFPGSSDAPPPALPASAASAAK